MDNLKSKGTSQDILATFDELERLKQNSLGIENKVLHFSLNRIASSSLDKKILRF